MAIGLIGVFLVADDDTSGLFFLVPAMVLAIVLVVMFVHERRGLIGVGVDVTDRLVRLGRFPRTIVDISRDEIARVTVSAEPWQLTAFPPAAGSFLLVGSHYLTVTTRSGEHYRVAYDQGIDTPPSPAAEDVARQLGVSAEPRDDQRE